MGVLSKTPSLSQHIRGKDALTQPLAALFGKLSCVITRTVFARGAASVILAGALALGMSGCVFITPKATLIEYSPSDGVGTSVGDVDVRNAVALVGEDGDTVSLMITFVNTGSKAAQVNLQFESDGEKTTITKSITRNSVESFGTTPDEAQIIIEAPGVSAGGLLPVYVQYGDHEGKELLVPVLEATGDYAALAPVTASE